MLTREERNACRTARFLKGPGHGFGTPALGLCPVGRVAALRGAVFQLWPQTGEYCSFDPIARDGRITYEPGLSWEIAGQAFLEVMAWAGFADQRDFLQALEEYGAAIFPAEEVVP